MKTFDFSQTGGYPLTQNRLARMQTAYMEALVALAKKAAYGYPVILTGMVSTAAGGGATAVSDGFFYYNGEIVRFQGSSYGALSGANVALIAIATNTSNLTYYNGSTPAVVIERVGTVSAAATATDANHVPLASMYDPHVINAGGAVDGDTITFTKSETHFYDLGSGLGVPFISTAALNFTNAIKGSKYTIVVTADAGVLVGKSFTLSGSYSDINRNVLPFTAGVDGNVVIDVEYIGTIGGNNYVRIKCANNS